MSNNLLAGIDYIFYAFIGGIWKPYMCARSQDDPVQTDFIDTTVAGSGNWRTVEPTSMSFDKNIQGVIAFNSGDNLTFPDIRSLQFAKEKLLCRTVMTSKSGDVYIEEAYCYIANSIPTGSFDGIATFSVAFKGTGPITQIYTPPPPTTGIVYRYPAAGSTAPPTTGSYVWIATGLANKNIINVVKDGRGSSNIILSGTPVGNEVLYETSGSNGVFTWAIPFEDGETPPYVEYQNT